MSYALTVSPDMMRLPDGYTLANIVAKHVSKVAEKSRVVASIWVGTNDRKDVWVTYTLKDTIKTKISYAIREHFRKSGIECESVKLLVGRENKRLRVAVWVDKANFLKNYRYLIDIINKNVSDEFKGDRRSYSEKDGVGVISLECRILRDALLTEDAKADLENIGYRPEAVEEDIARIRLIDFGANVLKGTEAFIKANKEEKTVVGEKDDFIYYDREEAREREAKRRVRYVPGDYARSRIPSEAPEGDFMKYKPGEYQRILRGEPAKPGDYMYPYRVAGGSGVFGSRPQTGDFEGYVAPWDKKKGSPEEETEKRDQLNATRRKRTGK